MTQNRGQLKIEDARKDVLMGEWQDKAGMLSTFSNGKFETRTPDTNEKLAEGNYNIEEDNSINIEVKSLVKGNVSKVNCNLRHFNNTLYCAPMDEALSATAFSLFRVN
ncbi:hypothetical protein [Bartonella sp. TP]|uniref:hypothetical protein n=1 Tax=Bartonella sp. TP TaxID=3057550 RepID=UPI0025B22F92|nr:hypothetical protein [Bartonella sp. TP]MDN5249637.1 hypothetical protein [Alphaproteobacteria bacterium]WJW80233.1 hypothetical protein QVL57_01320 [Bartonella sp. TP]